MEQLYQAWQSAQKKRAGVYAVFACTVAIMTFAAFAEQTEVGWIRPLAVVPICAVIVWLVFGRMLSRRLFRKQMDAILAEAGCADRFYATVDKELRHDLRDSFFYRQYRLSMYLTQNWLILISANGTVIRLRSQIRDVRSELHPSNSRDALILDFTDGSAFCCRCSNVCDEIIRIIERYRKETI